MAEEIQQQQRSSTPPPQRESELIRPKPLIVQNPASVQRQSSIPPPQNNRPYEQQQPPSAPAPSPIYPSINEQVTYRNTETHPDRLNYPTQQQQQQPPLPQSQPPQLQLQVQPPKTSPSHEQLSPISPLNLRYSTSSPGPQSQQNQRVSEELRGQLPWSYTSIPPPTPKKPQMQVYPEIPEPDYGH